MVAIAPPINSLLDRVVNTYQSTNSNSCDSPAEPLRQLSLGHTLYGRKLPARNNRG